ncbi:MAG: Flp pilus assembly complex ATPase component TadA [Proteobacteria bacterium]|nr:Flp pilus assembly complex ATPase component TadA [Pseudomonadota bacterium]
MKQKKRLGEMLKEAGLLTEEQLQKAIRDHRKTNMKLGQYLVREGIVSESKLVDVVSQQTKVKKYSSEKYPFDVNMANVLPADIARKFQVVPLLKKGFLLTIAMIDPLDIVALDAIEDATNTEVEAVICTEQELNHLTSNLYGSYSGFGDVMEDVDASEEAEVKSETGLVEVDSHSLQDMAEEAPVIRLVNSILSQAVREGASDIHMSPEKDYVQLRFRVDGKLHEVPAPPKSLFLPVVSRIKLISNLDIAVSRIPQDGRFTLQLQNKEINIRTSTLPTIYGENVVMRLLDTSSGIYTLEQLGMPEKDRNNLARMINKPYGLILSTGPTGSGKSTTLFSLLKVVNQPDVNIITLEDPVEYRMEGARQVQLNRKAGMTFASGLKSILRQDPDVVMVGEIRDAETASVAVQASLTGHRVLSTVHTNDSAGAITRFIDMGVEPFLVSSVLLVSIAQRLVRTVCPDCKEPYKPPQRALEFWGLDKVEGADFVKGRGCFNCMDTGFKGRIGLYEILIVNEKIQDMIIAGNSSVEIIREARTNGDLRTLKDDAANKILNGLTTIEEATKGVMV